MKVKEMLTDNSKKFICVTENPALVTLEDGSVIEINRQNICGGLGWQSTIGGQTFGNAEVTAVIAGEIPTLVCRLTSTAWINTIAQILNTRGFTFAIPQEEEEEE